MRPLFSTALLGLLALVSAHAENTSQVSQYGVTWTFDRPRETGRFVTGDYWVLGPVTIVSVSPKPGPSADTSPAVEATKSRYGAAALVDDRRMRNGSMIVAGPSPRGPKNSTGFDQQGYDSRAINYEPSLSQAFPLLLNPGTSLISTVSNEARDDAGKLATPSVLGEFKFFLTGPLAPLALRSAAILTVLEKAPPADAFRPSYAGKDKTIYRAGAVRRDLLPKLKPVDSTPDWDMMERIFERPWLDHTASWTNQHLLPGENQPAYGREFARLTSIAALMVMLDVPPERREKLLLSYIQLGIDLSGVARMGRHWFPDGGHWQGRKWPILFASMMLDAPALRDFPKIDPAVPVYGYFKVVPVAGTALPTTLFQEDITTYYGRGGDGQTVLWQIGSHTGPKQPYEEKPRADFDKGINFLEAYRPNNACSWIGTALAARYMKAVAVWNHDAYFDYMDRWMSPDEKWDQPKWLPKGATRSFDLFTEEMWRAHRASAPAQPKGKDNLKWVWDSTNRSGSLVPNPPVTP
jgi:hypothetical protein